MLKLRDADKPSTSATTSTEVTVPRLAANNKVVLSAENRPVKLKEKARIVLDEEDYTNDLEKIIVRDYFPELPKLKVRVSFAWKLFNDK